MSFEDDEGRERGVKKDGEIKVRGVKKDGGNIYLFDCHPLPLLDGGI